jgi:hypothetical protein
MADRSEVTHAVLQRFLPATGAVYLGVLAASAIAEPGTLSWVSLGIAGASVALVTAGFGTVAALFASALRPTVGVARRSLVAGFAAPLALGALSVFTQGATLPTIAVLTFAAGALTGLVTLGSGTFGRRGEEPLDPAVKAEMDRLEAELALASPPEYARLEASAIAASRPDQRAESRAVAE